MLTAPSEFLFQFVLRSQTCAIASKSNSVALWHTRIIGKFAQPPAMNSVCQQMRLCRHCLIVALSICDYKKFRPIVTYQTLFFYGFGDCSVLFLFLFFSHEAIPNAQGHNALFKCPWLQLPTWFFSETLEKKLAWRQKTWHCLSTQFLLTMRKICAQILVVYYSVPSQLLRMCLDHITNWV